MKFSEFEAETWEEMRTFFDTCLIPVTGLTGNEAPYKAAERLEELREVMDWIESPFQGRIVTYPAIQYGGVEIADLINSVCRKVRQAGFTYVVIASTLNELTEILLPEADLVVTQEQYPIDEKQRKGQNLAVEKQIHSMWQGVRKR